MGIFAGTTPGFMTSQVALAPAYAGTVSSVATAAFQVGAIVAPYLVGAITTGVSPSPAYGVLLIPDTLRFRAQGKNGKLYSLRSRCYWFSLAAFSWSLDQVSLSGPSTVATHDVIMSLSADMQAWAKVPSVPCTQGRVPIPDVAMTAVLAENKNADLSSPESRASVSGPDILRCMSPLSNSYRLP